jgi:hypothetical protein
VKGTFVRIFIFLLVLVLVTGVLFNGCEKKKEATYTIGIEDVPDLEKGEQEVKGEKVVNPLEKTEEAEEETEQ